MAVVETALVVLFGLALGAGVAVLPFVVPTPRALLTEEFMRVWMALGPVLTLTGIWIGLRRRGRVKARRPVSPVLHLNDN